MPNWTSIFMIRVDKRRVQPQGVRKGDAIIFKELKEGNRRIRFMDDVYKRGYPTLNLKKL